MPPVRRLEKEGLKHRVAVILELRVAAIILSAQLMMHMMMVLEMMGSSVMSHL